MKKIFGLFFTLSVIVFCSNIILAEPVFPEGNLTTNPIQVVADFRGKGLAEFSIELRNISDDKVTNEIGWTIQDVVLKQQSDQWKWSTTYAVITATVTKPNINYYLYQKNTESTVYKSTAPRTNEGGFTVYSGLVNKELQGGEYRGYVPLSFLFTAEKLTSSDLQKTYDPETMTPDKVARYFKDTADSDFNGGQYAVIACANTGANTGGIAFYPYGEGGTYSPWAPRTVMQSKTAYMYFGGNFMNIFRGDIFGTDQIYIEKVVE